MFDSLNKFLLIHFVLISLVCCREEIIEPDNFAGNMNEPVQLRDNNSYTFLLNARNLTMNINISAHFNSSRTRFNITLIDYESGYLNVSVKDYATAERFKYRIAEDVSYYTELLDGYVPATYNIVTENFSGKIRIQFRKIL